MREWVRSTAGKGATVGYTHLGSSVLPRLPGSPAAPARGRFAPPPPPPPAAEEIFDGFYAKNLVPHRGPGAGAGGDGKFRVLGARRVDLGVYWAQRRDVLTSAAALRIARVAMSRHPVRHTHNISHTESKYKQYIWPIGNTSKETQAQWPKRMLCVGHPIFSRRSALAWFASTCTLTLPHPALFSIWNVQSDFHTGKYATKKEAEAAFESTIQLDLFMSYF